MLTPQEQRAARSLRRWLRRAALSAIPLTGLACAPRSGCLRTDQIAAAAWLEGAAVYAFDALKRELIAHGAPGSLIERARSAQQGERRHYRTMSALAARFGAAVQPVELEPIGIRPLLDVALENAVEGCVRETWGAAVAAYQGECATDRAVRRAMRSIAEDEAEHAALGWAVDAWARSRLSPEEGERLTAARAKACEDVFAQEDAALELLGLPDAAARTRMFAALRPIWIA